MKKILLYIFILFSTSILAQQATEGFSYQAVVRGEDGTAIENTDLEVIVQLFERDNVRPIYSEVHETTTDKFGQINLIIGNGLGNKEDFKSIPWSSGSIYYRIHLINEYEDLNIMSEAQILAVPYAYHANTANSLSNQEGSIGRNDIKDDKFWSVEGNNIFDRNNKLGTLTNDPLNIITNDITRIVVGTNGDIEVNTSLDIQENLNVQGLTNLNDMVVQNSVNVKGEALLEGNLNVNESVQIDKDLHVLNNTVLDGNLAVGRDFTATGAVLLNGGLTVGDMSPTYLTGELTVDKDAFFNAKVDVDGETTLNNSLDVDGPTTLNNTLDVDGITTLNDALDVDGITTLNNQLVVDGSTKLNNTLTVERVSTFNDVMSVTKDVADGGFVATFENTNVGNGDGINIKLGKNRTNLAPPNLPALMSANEINQIKNLIKCDYQGSKINLLGNIVVEGLQADVEMIAGLAIGTGNILLNFINTNLGLPYNIPKGFIVKGYRLLHIGMPSGIPDVNVHLPDLPPVEVPLLPSLPNISLNALGIPEIPIYDLNFWGIPNICLSDAPGSTPLNNENEFIRFSDKSDVKMGSIRAASVSDWSDNYLTVSYLFKLRGAITSAVDKKHARYHFKALVSDAIQDYIKIGVEYSSGNGDYAEWLERADIDERITPGDIVGVKGAKITKDLSEAEQVMVVSHNPIVLGNVPPSGKIHVGNNIAFMGQVPVKVMGPVNSGDYIVGQPNTPGYGIAKSKSEMTAKDFELAVGRAWEGVNVNGPVLVNTVVGIHNGDYSRIFKKMDNQIKNNADRLDQLESKISAISSTLNHLESN